MLNLTSISSYFSYSFVWYALITVLLIALCASLLGVVLVLKRFSFLGDGLSHTAFGAVAIASAIGVTNNMFIVMPITIISAILLLVFSKKAKLKGDSIIAMTSVGCLAIGYILMKIFPNPNVGEVDETLFGSNNLLTLSLSNVILVLAIAIIVVGFFIIFYNKIFSLTFDEDFAKSTGVKTNIYNLIISVIIAVIIVISMKLIGSLLVSALIVFPAVSAMRLFKTYKSVTIASVVFGVIASLIGFIFSLILNTPVGPTIVVVDIIGFVIFYILSKIKKAA